MDKQDIERLFTYYDGSAQQIDLCVKVRDAIWKAADAVVEHTPPGADQSAAVRKLREALQTAIAAIIVPTARKEEANQ